MIQTNEILLKDNKHWLHFSTPHRIIETHDLQDVLPALREIEDLVNIKGWHAAGFLSYESAPAFDRVHVTPVNPDETQPRDGFPYLWFGLYPVPRFVTPPEPDPVKPVLTWLPTTDQETYNAAIARIKEHIAHGQTYQVNYTMRLQSDFRTDPWNFFLHLVQSQNNHAAYIDTGRFVLASVSPELFFQLNGETITCRPMKGTVKRGRTTTEDREQAEWLQSSEKNRAENIMIVDMIRNDLGRIAKVGSVKVTGLFAVEKYPTLWQMTSTITAKTDGSLTNILSALFPCASITGAPKASTMRIISELETTPRKIYTGSIGYFSPHRRATFNVAIRTALIDRKTRRAEYGVGGGIIWDSTSTDEYAEALLKARVLTESTPEFSLLETMLWTSEEGFFLRRKHISRLIDSAEYFNFSANHRTVEETLNQTAASFTSPQRVRLLVDRQGHIKIENKPFQIGGKPLRVCLAEKPIFSNNIFLFHKTTLREVYDQASGAAISSRRKKLLFESENYDDVLLFNERGELTEFTIGNLVVEINDRFYTPPISCGLLAGTFREFLLETAQVEEGIVRVEDLRASTRIFLVNSVRKWQRVDLELV